MRHLSTPLVLLGVLLCGGARMAAQEGAPAVVEEDPAAVLCARLAEPTQRRDACLGLLRLGRKAVPALCRVMRNKDKELACIAFDLVSRMSGEATQAVGVLRELRGAEEAWRVHAARFTLHRVMLQRQTFALDRHADKVWILGPDGQLLRTLRTGKNLYDVEAVPGGGVLLCELREGRVVELDKQGKVVWEFKGNRNPLDADRLPDGNTLIAGGSTKEVVEVDPKGKVVWRWQGTKWPNDADRLPWGTTLVTDSPAGKIYEVDRQGKVLRAFAEKRPIDVQLLRDGRIMFVTSVSHTVILLDPQGQRVGEIKAEDAIQCATQGFGGTLLLGTKKGVIARSAAGRQLWRSKVGTDIKAVVWH